MQNSKFTGYVTKLLSWQNKNGPVSSFFFRFENLHNKQKKRLEFFSCNYIFKLPERTMTACLKTFPDKKL